MEFWTNRSPRERLLISVALALGVLLIVTQGLVQPLFSWRADQVAELEKSRGVYALVEQAATRSAMIAQNSQGGELDARTAITRSAARLGVSLVYVKAQEAGIVDASAAQVAPEALFGWLEALDKEHGVRVLRIDIAREQTQQNLLRAQITFTGGAQ